MIDTALIGALTEASPAGVRTDVALADITGWRIGGRADAIVDPATAEEAAAVMRVMSGRPEAFLVIGETTNLLFDSRGFDGVLMRIGPRLAQVRIDGSRVTAQGGARVPELVKLCAEQGLGGIVHAAGVPGTIGGLALMNGGSRRKGIGSHIAGVLVAELDGHLRRFGRDELSFAYRRSNLQGTGSAILAVELELQPADANAELAEIDEILSERAAKFPLDLPSGGSVFLSDPAMYKSIGPPGRAIEEAGLKGVRVGGAQISPRHANFIVNLGGATDDDVLRLIARARGAVRARTGFAMDCEVGYVTREGALLPAHEVAEERWRDDGEA
jgi:UDP-N-acetylmuramate dehydrogenase